VHRPNQAVLIANVSDEPAKAWVIPKTLARLVLLQLVSRENNDLLRVEV